MKSPNQALQRERKKTFHRILSAFTALGLLGSFAFAAERPAKEAGPRRQAQKAGSWNVRVEVLMVAMPQEKALALLPDLRDAAKIEGAVAQILAAIDRKEATLVGYPTVMTLDGVRCVVESILEKRYSTLAEMQAAQATAGQTPPAKESLLISDGPPLGEAETRNVGVTLEVEPRVSAGGDWVRLVVAPQRIAFLGFDPPESVKLAGGKFAKVEQPQFTDTKTTTTVKLRSGQRYLLSVHKLQQPENVIELHIIQATVTPAQ